MVLSTQNIIILGRVDCLDRRAGIKVSKRINNRKTWSEKVALHANAAAANFI